MDRTWKPSSKGSPTGPDFGSSFTSPSDRGKSIMSLALDLNRRRSGILGPEVFMRKNQVTEAFVERLGLKQELEGHEGCVNCIQWSQDGKFLASGSDDCKVIVWSPFFRKIRLKIINTEHRSNIFSVKFLPCTGNGLIATGAADTLIQVQDVVIGKTVLTFSNHSNRVKRLAVANDCPNIFWSASEDGTVMEFDIRAPSSETKLLVNFNRLLEKDAEAKCVSVNQRRPELLAVGANDPYARVFDRRKMKTQLVQFPEAGAGTGTGTGRMTNRSWERRVHLTKMDALIGGRLSQCSKYYSPGHLRRGLGGITSKGKRRNFQVNYLTFSPQGSELLVNLGGEQIYLFDLINPSTQILGSPDLDELLGGKDSSSTSCNRNGFHAKDDSMQREVKDQTSAVRRESSPNMAMPDALELMKVKANAEYGAGRYSAAIALYNRSLLICNHPILYGNRAAAYMKRKWEGDLYAAIRDCYYVLSVDPDNAKARLRIARCLTDLGWPKAPEQCRELQKDGSTYPAEVSMPATVTKEGQIDSDDDDDDDDDEEDEGEFGSEGALKSIEEEEEWCRRDSFDYTDRFCGHCNTTTDIKEANFFGNNGQFIIAGSDDGKFFCWDRYTKSIVRVLKGDDSIVNCLQPHPSTCLLATSGIDSVVRLWEPLPEDGRKNVRSVDDLDKVMYANQKRMRTDPFEAMLMDMNIRYRASDSADGDDDSDDGPASAIQCRTS